MIKSASGEERMCTLATDRAGSKSCSSNYWFSGSRQVT